MLVGHPIRLANKRVRSSHLTFDKKSQKTSNSHVVDEAQHVAPLQSQSGIRVPCAISARTLTIALQSRHRE
jgi:hypothetical protein